MTISPEGYYEVTLKGKSKEEKEIIEGIILLNRSPVRENMFNFLEDFPDVHSGSRAEATRIFSEVLWRFRRAFT